MNMTQAAIKRGVTFAMLYLVVVGFGLFSLMRLNLDLFPELNFPYISVITQYSGVGPYDIETALTRPIEETVASVKNVKKITSATRQGLSLVMLEFKWGTDMDQAETDVRRNLDFVRDYLPPDASEPLVFKLDPAMQPILYLALSSSVYGEAELRRISEQNLEPRIERINGVASVYTSGGLKREIKVLVDPVRLKAHNIAIQQVQAALQAANLQIASGYVEDSKQEFSIETAGQYTNLEQIAATSVGSFNGSVIHVRDVATVVDGFAEVRQQVWNNGRPATFVVVQKSSDANTVSVCRDIKGQLDRIVSELPRGVKVEVAMDMSDFIVNSMSNLTGTAWQAVLLTFLVLLFFLRNLRSSLIVAVSIPVSVIVTFAVMDQAGITLNIISMAGLALAIGMLVDNSIVVLENIFRHHDELHENLRMSAEKGTQEVSMAITASTLTTLVVFLPVLFVPGLAGQLFKDMVITICFSLTISLLVALTLIPLLASRMLRISRNLNPNGLTMRSKSIVGNWLDKLYVVHKKVLNWSLDHKKTVLFGTALLAVISVVSLFFTGGEFMAETDQGYMSMTIERTPGTSMAAMEKSMVQLSDMVQKEVPEADNIYFNFGQGEGIMAMFSSRSAAQGDMTLRLKPMSQRQRDMFAIQDALRPQIGQIADMEVKFEDRGATMFNQADIVLNIFGHDLQTSEVIAKDVTNRLKNIKGVAEYTTNIDKPSPELKINLDRQRVADLGLSTAQVGNTVSLSVLGAAVTRYREKGDEYDIRLQLDKRSRSSKEDLENLLIMTPTGQQIPLRAIATIDYDKTPQEINREDQERIVTVNVSVSGRDLQSVTKDVEKIIKQVPMPSDYRIEISGAAQDMFESFLYLGLAFIVAMFLTYMVMASQFESLVDPFIIMFTIPLSIIGVAMALYMTGTDMSVMALIGIVMLVGIVVNNGIVLVDVINQLRSEGMELYAAIREGSRIRLRPVLMTALTTVMGMLPLALGVGESGESWAPMARSVMGGLTVATVLTLVIVPIIYAYMEHLADWIRLKKGQRQENRLAKGKIVTQD